MLMEAETVDSYGCIQCSHCLLLRSKCFLTFPTASVSLFHVSLESVTQKPSSSSLSLLSSPRLASPTLFSPRLFLSISVPVQVGFLSLVTKGAFLTLNSGFDFNGKQMRNCNFKPVVSV